jgi:hypothetical protein
MAAAGVSPGARDRDELFRMGAEKVTVFYQSWANMWWQGVRLQCELAQSLASSAPSLWAGKHVFGPWPGKASTAAGARVLSAGLAPVHRKAVANSKRLSRRRK